MQSTLNESPDAHAETEAWTQLAPLLDDALACLGETDRTALVLRYFENMKIHELAAHLDLSPGTVKSRLHYALAEMQKILPAEMNLFGVAGTEKPEPV